MHFETLYQELSNSTEMIRTLLAGIDQEQAQVKPDVKSWSILEVTCHLRDEEQADFRARLDSILNRPQEEFAVIDPQGWITERKYNEQDFKKAQEVFFTEREKSLEWPRSLSAANWDASHIDQYGTCTAGEMFASWVAHDNLHIRQLVELRRARIERITMPYPIEYAGDW